MNAGILPPAGVAARCKASSFSVSVNLVVFLPVILGFNINKFQIGCGGRRTWLTNRQCTAAAAERA